MGKKFQGNSVLTSDTACAIIRRTVDKGSNMDSILKLFEENKFIAAVRSSSAEDAEAMFKAAFEGGFRLFEISMQTAQAIKLVESLSKIEGALIGVSGVTDGEMAQRAINAGAKFISSPFTDRDVIAVAKHNDVFVMQGAATPTEALNAHHFGADLIKIYPIGVLGGADYLKRIKTSLPHIKFVASGGVSLENAFVYLKDCVAISIGRALFDRMLLRTNNWAEITERARQLTSKLETLKVSKS